MPRGARGRGDRRGQFLRDSSAVGGAGPRGHQTPCVGDRGTPRRAGWFSAALLFLYAVPFSFAYNTLTTGTGALILFAAVQATMLLAGLVSGERPRLLQWIGLASALGGMTYLVLPGVTAPSPTGSVLMAVAGIAWGLYSLHGRGAVDPLGETRDNFVRSVPMVAVVSLLSVGDFEITPAGALLAVTSGALASGAGYAIWYTVLGGLTATFAATVQLSVPVIAAGGRRAHHGRVRHVSARALLRADSWRRGAGTPAIAAGRSMKRPPALADVTGRERGSGGSPARRGQSPSLRVFEKEIV